MISLIVMKHSEKRSNRAETCNWNVEELNNISSSVNKHMKQRRLRMKMWFFWYVAPCSLARVDRRFGRAYCVHYQSNAWWWWWTQYARVKRRYTPARLHGAISQNTLLFILDAVRTSDLKRPRFYCKNNYILRELCFLCSERFNDWFRSYPTTSQVTRRCST
jgi:hypothetical protein